MRENLVPVLQIAAAITAVAAGGFSLISLSWTWVTIAVSAASSVAAIVMGRSDERKVSALLREVERLDEALDGERYAIRRALQHMAERLLKQRNLWTASCRISVYGHSGSSVYLLARASRNPVLAKPMRAFYSDASGYISKVWAEGEFFRRFKGADSIRAFSIEHGYTLEEFDSLSMKPLSVVGVRLEVGRQSVGLVLVESTKKTELDESLIDELRVSDPCLDIADTVAAAQRVFEEISLSHSSQLR